MTTYAITGRCIRCKLCYTKCPKKCIDITKRPFVIGQDECIGCGRCKEICPMDAIEERHITS